MLFLIATLLAAGEPAAEFSLAAGAGSRGERRAEAVAHASSSDLALTLGAADFEGPQAPRRQEVLFGAQAGVVRADVRAVPGSSGLSRLGAELGVHFESLGLILGARTASLGRDQLRAAGARLELEGQIREALRAGLTASAWALQLDARSPRNAWTAWGNATLDWAQRWETGLWVSADVAELFSLTPSVSVAQSAQPGVFEARAALALEVPLGPVKLRAEPALSRQWPRLWMLDFTAAVTLALQ